MSRQPCLTAYDAEKLALKECGKYIRKYIDRERIVRMWEGSPLFNTQKIIADVCGCSISTVRKVLREEGFEEEYRLVDGSVVKKIWHTKPGDKRRGLEKW